MNPDSLMARYWLERERRERREAQHREELQRVALAAMRHRRGTPMHVTDEDALNGTISYRGLDIEAILAEPKA